jgi:hypothetical protein
MKAIVHRAYGPPGEVLALEDVGTPACGDDHVLVRVRAASARADADRSERKRRCSSSRRADR